MKESSVSADRLHIICKPNLKGIIWKEKHTSIAHIHECMCAHTHTCPTRVTKTIYEQIVLYTQWYIPEQDRKAVGLSGIFTRKKKKK